MKLLKVLCVIALVFAMSAIAYAETQSVKVSGDLAMRAFARNNYDLCAGDTETAQVESTDWATYLTSTAEVQIDADLTDNVSGVVRLVNQRVWGNFDYSNQAGGELMEIDPNGTAAAVATTTSAGDAFDVNIDLAYIELKEFLYSPLTLRIGRQDLWFGRGFIIGNSLTNPTFNLYPAEYTAISSFDAIRATLDYDPWTIDAVYAKIAENARRNDDDINLWGVNVGYVFDAYNAEAEAYWFMKQSRNVANAANIGLTSLQNSGVVDNSVHTIGGRGSFDPIEDWTVALEGAFQLGDYMVTNQVNERTREAWAVDAMVECRYFQDNFAWRPVLSAEYIFYSGEGEALDQTAASTGDWNAWDPMFRGKFDTAIREFQNVFYATNQASTASFTNQHQVIVKGTVEPTDSLTVQGAWAHFWLAESVTATSQGAAPWMSTNKNIGDELDLQLTWDYTEDVQFGLLWGCFIPGSHWQDNQDDIATDLVGTVKLSF